MRARSLEITGRVLLDQQGVRMAKRIVRHSEAKNATIRLEWDVDSRVLLVEDDGKGFYVGEITSID